MLRLNERYIVDAKGQTVAVVLDVADYRRLLDELRLAGLLQTTPAAQLTDAERETVRRAAQQAVGEIRAGAQIRGLDQFEADDIETAIRETRRERRQEKPAP